MTFLGAIMRGRKASTTQSHTVFFFYLTWNLTARLVIVSHIAKAKTRIGILNEINAGITFVLFFEHYKIEER